MKIAFDARWLLPTGTGDVTYLRCLLRALAHAAPDDEIHLYYREFNPEREALAARFTNIHAHALHFPVGSLWNQCALAPRLARDEMSLLHGNYMLPFWAPRPMIVTIHDVTFRMFPRWIPRRAQRIMNVLIPLSARRATKIITGSQCSKDDMVREFGIAPEKIAVTPYAAAPHFTAGDPMEAHWRIRDAFPDLSGQFLAGVGLRGPRKNIGIVLRAILQLQARGAWPNGLKLALTGTREQFPDAEIEKLGETVVFLGFIEEKLLSDLFTSALASVYPSFYEGFGLPVLEAMACGCPVLCSNTSSLPEVVGEAAVLLSPTDENAWAAALEKVLHDENHRVVLRSLGLQRADHFSWEKCARQTLEIYREVARG